MRERQALGDGGLADAGLADEDRVVLAAAAEHLDGALELVLAADQRIDLPGRRLLDEVDGVRLQRIVDRLRAVSSPSASSPARRLRPAAAPATRPRDPSSDPVRDEVEDVEPRDALLLEQVDRVRVALAVERDQHLPPSMTSLPDDCTCIAARCSTRQKAAVCCGSRSAPSGSSCMFSSKNARGRSAASSDRRPPP